MVKSTAESNPDTFESLVQNSKYKMYKVAMAILKNDDDACDAIQEALLSAYKNFYSLREPQYFNTWITRILINKCYDIINQKKKIAFLNKELELDGDASYYDRYKEESIVENVLNQIDSDLKTVTLLYYYNEFQIDEIAEILNIPVGTVKSSLSRAREKIYAILKREEVNGND